MNIVVTDALNAIYPILKGNMTKKEQYKLQAIQLAVEFQTSKEVIRYIKPRLLMNKNIHFQLGRITKHIEGNQIAKAELEKAIKKRILNPRRREEALVKLNLTLILTKRKSDFYMQVKNFLFDLTDAKLHRILTIDIEK
jgi:hypothetical protein